MLKATEVVIDKMVDAKLSLTLPFELRQKSRLKATLDNGDEIGLMLPRGTVLRGGDFLKTEDGAFVVVKAAREMVSTATIEDPQLFARACYHLGNRHVPLQIGVNWVRYLHDHVLDEMLSGLGIVVSCEQASFEPEAGAYGGHAHHHH
ncbi:MAG: urease accessory protein UreE [Thioalkalispiraceae bacterium]|jgi:urease accessory protein